MLVSRLEMRGVQGATLKGRAQYVWEGLQSICLHLDRWKRCKDQNAGDWLSTRCGKTHLLPDMDWKSV
jgi:hypothetical protein